MRADSVSYPFSKYDVGCKKKVITSAVYFVVGEIDDQDNFLTRITYPISPSFPTLSPFSLAAVVEVIFTSVQIINKIDRCIFRVKNDTRLFHCLLVEIFDRSVRVEMKFDTFPFFFFFFLELNDRKREFRGSNIVRQTLHPREAFSRVSLTFRAHFRQVG